jgi:hypothetical protein
MKSRKKSRMVAKRSKTTKTRTRKTAKKKKNKKNGDKERALHDFISFSRKEMTVVLQWKIVR